MQSANRPNPKPLFRLGLLLLLFAGSPFANAKADRLDVRLSLEPVALNLSQSSGFEQWTTGGTLSLALGLHDMMMLNLSITETLDLADSESGRSTSFYGLSLSYALDHAYIAPYLEVGLAYAVRDYDFRRGSVAPLLGGGIDVDLTRFVSIGTYARFIPTTNLGWPGAPQAWIFGGRVAVYLHRHKDSQNETFLIPKK